MFLSENTPYDQTYERSNAKIVDKCDICGEAIHEGDEYYDVFERNICMDCMKDFKKIGKKEE